MDTDTGSPCADSRDFRPWCGPGGVTCWGVDSQGWLATSPGVRDSHSWTRLLTAYNCN